MLPSTILTSGSRASANLTSSAFAPARAAAGRPKHGRAPHPASRHFGVAHAGNLRLAAALPPAWPCGSSRVRRAAERNDLGQRAEAEEIGLVERADAGLAETAVDAQRHAADAERRAEPCGETAAGDQALDRSAAGVPPARSGPKSRAPDRTRSGWRRAPRPAPGRCAAAPPWRSPEWRQFAPPGRRARSRPSAAR